MWDYVVLYAVIPYYMHKHIPVNVVTRNLVNIVPKKALSWFSRTLHSGQNQVEGFMLPEDPFVSTTAFSFSLICLLSSLEVAPLVAQLHLICLFPSHLPTWWWEKQISSWKDRKLDCSQKDYLKIKKNLKRQWRWTICLTSQVIDGTLCILQKKIP